MVELLTKPHCRACVLGSQAALTEISPVCLEADAEIDACVGSCLLGQSIPIGKRRQDSEGKAELQGGSKGLSINSWRELSGLDGPSELDPHLLPQEAQIFIVLCPRKEVASSNGVTRGSGRQARINSLSLNTQDTESEGQSGWHTTKCTREPKRQECVP